MSDKCVLWLKSLETNQSYHKSLETNKSVEEPEVEECDPLSLEDNDVICIDDNDKDPRPPFSSFTSFSKDNIIGLKRTRNFIKKRKIRSQDEEIKVVEVKANPNKNGASSKDTFLHFNLTKLNILDLSWVDRVKSRIVRKYFLPKSDPKETGKNSRRNRCLSLFFTTVKCLKEGVKEEWLMEVAIEALYLKTLYPKSGVRCISTFLMKRLNQVTFSMRSMLYLYFIHVILSMEIRIFSRNDEKQFYRESFLEYNLSKTLKDIVIKAPIELKYDLYSLRLKWSSFFPRTLLQEIDKNNFWTQQGLDPLFLDSSLSISAVKRINGETDVVGADTGPIPRKSKRNCVHNVNKKVAVEILTVGSSSCSDDSDRSSSISTTSNKHVNKRPCSDSDSDSSSSSVAIVRDLAPKSKNIINITLDDEETDNKNDIQNTLKSKYPDLDFKPCFVQLSTSIIKTKSIPVPEEVPNSSLCDKTGLLIVDGKLSAPKKSLDQLQRMLQRKKALPTVTLPAAPTNGIFRYTAPAFKIPAPNPTAPKTNGIFRYTAPAFKVPAPNPTARIPQQQPLKKVSQVHIENVMSSEFVDNLLTPTLANFEIIFENGVAKTKFTHVTNNN